MSVNIHKIAKSFMGGVPARIRGKSQKELEGLVNEKSMESLYVKMY